MIWLEPEDTEGNENPLRLYLDEAKKRRQLKKDLKKSEVAHRMQKDRAGRYLGRLREQEREMEAMRRELFLHREILRLRAVNERLRSKQKKADA